MCGSGRVLVPINFRLRPDEIAYIVAHSGARVLYVDPELVDSLKGVDVEHTFVLGEDGSMYAEPGVEPRPWEPDENATATINYTSGTTARPKGVQLTHRNLWTNAVTFGLHAGVSDRDVYLHTLPMFHANGWGMPFAMTGLGVPQVVLRKVDGAEILRRVEQHGVTVMCAAPAVAAAVLEAAQDWEGEIPGRDRVRIIMAGRAAAHEDRRAGRGGARLGVRADLRPHRDLAAADRQPHAAPSGTTCRPRSGPPGSCAPERPRSAYACAPMPSDGEVLARSNVVLEGYWEQPEETEQALVDGWFHTGDGGVIGDDGYLTISDRKKDVIITGGENVSSIEVEDVLFSHPAVAEVAVIGVPSEKWGETIKALVVLAEGASADEAELIAWCKDKAAGYKAPTSIEFRDELARTATGKLQKFKLRQPYWEGQRAAGQLARSTSLRACPASPTSSTCCTAGTRPRPPTRGTPSGWWPATRRAEVARVMFAVDPTVEVAREAVEWGADLLVVHHPLFLTPVTAVAADTPKGRTLHTLNAGGCALLTAHTNADQAVGGVSESLALALGLTDLAPIRPAPAGPLDKIVAFVPVDDGGRRPHGHDRRGRGPARRLRLVHLDRDGRGPVPPARRRHARDRRGRRPRGGRGGAGRGGGAARPSYGGGAGAAGRPPLRGAGLRRGPARRPRAGGHRHRPDRHGRGDDARASSPRGSRRRCRRRRTAYAWPATRSGRCGRSRCAAGRATSCSTSSPTATSTSTSPATSGTTARPSSSSTTGRPWSMSRTGRPSGPGCRRWRLGCVEEMGDRVDTRVSTRCTDPWTFRH